MAFNKSELEKYLQKVQAENRKRDVELRKKKEKIEKEIVENDHIGDRIAAGMTNIMPAVDCNGQAKAWLHSLDADTKYYEENGFHTIDVEKTKDNLRTNCDSLDTYYKNIKDSIAAYGDSNIVSVVNDFEKTLIASTEYTGKDYGIQELLTTASLNYMDHTSTMDSILESTDEEVPLTADFSETTKEEVTPTFENDLTNDFADDLIEKDLDKEEAMPVEKVSEVDIPEVKEVEEQVVEPKEENEVKLEAPVEEIALDEVSETNNDESETNLEDTESLPLLDINLDEPASLENADSSLESLEPLQTDSLDHIFPEVDNDLNSELDTNSADLDFMSQYNDDADKQSQEAPLEPLKVISQEEIKPSLSELGFMKVTTIEPAYAQGLIRA